MTVPEVDGESRAAHRLRTIAARRDRVLDLIEAGIYDEECTATVLGELDAQELGMVFRDKDEVRRFRDEE